MSTLKRGFKAKTDLDEHNECGGDHRDATLKNNGEVGEFVCGLGGLLPS